MKKVERSLSKSGSKGSLRSTNWEKYLNVNLGNEEKHKSKRDLFENPLVSEPKLLRMSASMVDFKANLEMPTIKSVHSGSPSPARSGRTRSAMVSPKPIKKKVKQHEMLPKVLHSESTNLPCTIPFLRETSLPKSYIKVINDKATKVIKGGKGEK
jgi:hypothetical protein